MLCRQLIFQVPAGVAIQRLYGSAPLDIRVARSGAEEQSDVVRSQH
jgi:hypothetical protein